MTEAPDDRLSEAFGALDPADAALTRIEATVLDSYDATQRSLTAEWIDLMRVRPAVHGALTLAAAAALLIVTPLGALVLSLLGR